VLLGASAVLALAAAAGEPGAPQQACAPDASKGTKRERSAGAVERVVIERNRVFDGRTQELPWPFRLANRIHTVTREGVVRQELLVGPGDCPDPEALAQTERNLRRLGFLRDAKIEVLPSHGGESVDLKVATFDTWSKAPRLRFAKVGNRLVWTLGVSEKNLLGRGQQVEVARRGELDREYSVVSFRDPRLGGTRIHAFAAHSSHSEGSRSELELARPFFALSTSWALRARYDAFGQLDPLYAGGERVADLRHDARWLDLEGGRSVRRTESGALRAHLAYRHRRDEVAGELRRFGIAEAGLSLVEHRFVKLTHVNRFETPEDFNLGHQLSLAAGVSAPALGGEAGRSLFFAVSERKGVQLGADRLLIGTLRWSGRRRHERWENAVGEARLDGLVRPARRALVLAAAQYRHGANLDPEVQLTLGAHNGLRGYAVHQWVGTRSLLAAGEARLFLADDVKQLASFGLAVFAEAGYAWPEGRPLALADLRRDVGVSLLIGRNRLSSTRRMTRIDLAYAIDRVPGRGRWLLSLGTQGAFLE
jgi:hypothetical protein